MSESNNPKPRVRTSHILEDLGGNLLKSIKYPNNPDYLLIDDEEINDGE